MPDPDNRPAPDPTTALASTDMAGAGEVEALREQLRETQAERDFLHHLVSKIGVYCESEDKMVPLRIEDDSDASVGMEGRWALYLPDGYKVETLSAAPPVEGLTSGEGEVLREYAAAAYAVMPGGPSVTDDMWRRYGKAADAYQAMLAAAPKATATASVRGFDLDDGEWFYPEGDHSSDECRHSADEVIDYALEGGAKSQVVCIERATSLPAVYAAVRVFTDAEKDERNSDDDYAYTLFATAEDARASLTDSGTAATIGGERA